MLIVPPASVAPKPRRESKADFLRRWELPYPTFQYHHLRYKSPAEKGVYWYYFSAFIRQRDIERWGTCISCTRPITFETCDAGHFMPTASCGVDLIFDERNVNAECSRCNAWDETHLLGYADGLDARYGAGTAANLRRRREEYRHGPRTKDATADEYAQKIMELATRMRELSPSGD